MGGKSSTSTQSNPVTNNTDRRLAVSDGQGITGDGSSIVNSFADNRQNTQNFVDSSSRTTIDQSNSDAAIRELSRTNSDAIQALTNAGKDIIQSSGGAVVELARFQGAQNTDAWNTTLSTSARLVDKLIDQASAGFGLSEKVVSAFTPTENKNADIGKYAMIAAAVVAGAVLLKGSK